MAAPGPAADAAMPHSAARGAESVTARSMAELRSWLDKPESVRELDVSGWKLLQPAAVLSLDILLAVVKANAGSLEVLRARQSHVQEAWYSHLTYIIPFRQGLVYALLSAAPRLKTLECDVWCRPTDDLVDLLTNQPAVRVFSICIDGMQYQGDDWYRLDMDDEDALKFAQAAGAHGSLMRVELSNTHLQAAGLRALLQLADTHLETLTLYGCYLPPEVLPELAELQARPAGSFLSELKSEVVNEYESQYVSISFLWTRLRDDAWKSRRALRRAGGTE